MTYIYNVLLDFINAFFPNDLAVDLLQLNQLLAYLMTLMFMWFFIIAPLVKLMKKAVK